MARIVKCGLIQTKCDLKGDEPVDKIKQSMIDKNLKLIEQAGQKNVQILCLQELFYGPYFPAEQETKWYSLTEKIPEGPTLRLMQDQAKKHGMVMVVPVYEEEITGVFTTPRLYLMRMVPTLENTVKTTFLIPIPGFGRNSTSNPAIWDIRFSRQLMALWAFTSVTIVIFLKVPGS